jgi:hypothetical protein|tara:strand:- start:1681 stop:1995 length:315 start_codon:yes stop_codon:yes gene_type:complete
LYLIRRIFNTKPGEARRVAGLLQQQAQAYRDAGQRSEFRVSYNGATLPGEQNVVVLDWTDDAIMSPSREGHVLPQAALDLGGQIRPLIENQRIEFLELLAPAKD